MASWKKLLTSGAVTASDVVSGTLATARIPSLDASKITSGTIADARLPGDCGARTTYDNYQYWKITSNLFDGGANVAPTNVVGIHGGTGITSTRSTRTISLALSSGAALANLGGSTGSTFLKKDGTWATPTDTNTTYSFDITENNPDVTVGLNPSSGSTEFWNLTSDGTISMTTNESNRETSFDITPSAVGTTELEDGAVSSAKLSSKPLYVLSYTLQANILANRYYMPNASLGANYSYWNRYLTALPTTVGGGTGTYCMPITIPKAGKVIKWGFNGQANSSLVGSCTWYLRYGTLSNGSSTSGTLATVGSDTTVAVTSSNRVYEWKQSGLSHTVAEDGVLVPMVKGSSSSTKYLRGSFYVVIEYDI